LLDSIEQSISEFAEAHPELSFRMSTYPSGSLQHLLGALENSRNPRLLILIDDCDSFATYLIRNRDAWKFNPLGTNTLHSCINSLLCAIKTDYTKGVHLKSIAFSTISTNSRFYGSNIIFHMKTAPSWQMFVD